MIDLGKIRGMSSTASCGFCVPAPSGATFRSANRLTRRVTYASRVDRAELPPIRFHDLRHSCATIHPVEGKHPKYVQERLGHASISITLDTYSRVVEEMDCSLADAMHGAL
jgi:integrase